MESQRTSLSDQDLRAQVAWVDRLARRLVSDPDHAADVAQDAWVRVLQRPLQDTSNVARLRAWLRRVVASAAIDSARSRKRRNRREAAAARPESTTSTLDVVERFATRRRVVEAVLALDEPYRTTVLLRHLDELDAATIAEQMGVSATTVRKRLSRGLAMLRARLGAGSAGDGITSWLAALFTLGPFRPRAAPTAGSTGGVVMAQSVSSAVTVKVVLCVLAVVAMMLSGLWIVGDGERPQPATTPLRGDVATLHTPEPERLSPIEIAAAPAERLEASPATTPPPAAPAVAPAAAAAPVKSGPLLTLITVDEEKRPVPGVEVRVAARSDEVLRTNADGRVQLPAEAGGSLQLLLLHERYLIERVDIDLPEDLSNSALEDSALEHVVVLRSGSVVRLAVTDARGAPLPGATIRLREMSSGTVDGTFIGTSAELKLSDVWSGFGGTDIREGTTGADGLGFVEGLRPGPYQLRVLANGFVEEGRRNVEVLPGLNDLGLVLLADAVLVQGVVLGPSGPLSGARVELLGLGEYASVVTGDAGAFAIHTFSAYPTQSRLMVRHDDHDTFCTSGLAINEEPLVVQLQARRVAQLLLIDPLLGTPIDGDVMVSREYHDDSMVFRPHDSERALAHAGELAIGDLESCLEGVLLKIEGYPRTWVSHEQLLRALAAPLTIFVEGENLVLLVVTHAGTGELLPEAGVQFGYEQIDEQGRENKSYSWHGSGSRSLFDAEAGGCPFDAQQLRVGRHADTTQRMWVAVHAEGYASSEHVVLVEGGKLVRRGVVQVQLEPLNDG